jgi:hypothetical protein
MGNDWWTNSDNVLSLANALVDAGIIDNIKCLLYYFSKPWKWDMEWKYLQQHKTLDNFEGEVRA